VRAVTRAVDILEQFTLEHPTRSFTEVARGTGLSKGTTHRLLATLEAVGMVELDPEISRYRLGLKVFWLGSVVLKSMSLVQQADPILARLLEETQESIFLVVPDGDRAMCLRRVDGVHSVRALVLETGMRVPYNCGASPRTLLAFLPEVQRREIIAHHVVRMTAHSLTTPEALETDAAEIRRRGYVVSREDLTLHAAAVGVPVRDHTGEVIASISVAGIVQRFSAEELSRLTELVLRAGEALSRRLGYREPAAPAAPAAPGD